MEILDENRFQHSIVFNIILSAVNSFAEMEYSFEWIHVFLNRFFFSIVFSFQSLVFIVEIMNRSPIFASENSESNIKTLIYFDLFSFSQWLNVCLFE